MSISLRIGKKDEKKNKKERDKSILFSYNDLLKELNLENNDKLKNIRLYLKHQEIGYIIIDNKEVWNFLHNFNIIQECIKKSKKNNKEFIDIEYEVIEHNEEKPKPNLSKVINYIIKHCFIRENFYLDVLIKFIEEYKTEFKNFFISELIEYKTNNKEEKENVISDGVETEEILKSFKEKISNFNQKLSNLKKISKIIEDEKSQEIIEINKSNYTDIKAKEIKNNPLNDSINEFINLKNYSISEQNPIFDVNRLIENGLFKVLTIQEYNEGFDEYKKKLKRNIIEDYKE